MADKPFAPLPAGTVNIDVSSSSGRVAITGTAENIRIFNDGTATAWVTFGNASVTAAVATGMPVGPGVCEVVGLALSNVNRDTLNVAAIAAGATGKIYFTPGAGI